MRKFLTLTCCFGLALMAGAQPNNQQNQQNKKKGGGNQPPPQQHVQTAPKVRGTQHFNANVQGQGQGMGQQHFKKGTNVGGQANMGTNLNSSKSNKFSKQNKFSNQTNVSGNAASTKFNKTMANKTMANKTMANKTMANKTMANKTINKNVTFQKQKFNLQTNNKQFVVNKFKTVTFNKNYKFQGFFGSNPHNWGPNYAVFVNYSPIWQPQWWWTSHYSHIVFIYGGWYYWNAGCWFPAWGYAPDSVYVYDGPIYSGTPDYDPAQTIANVQSALQQQGYYQGEIDGILGPQTRAALADYQAAQGLETTGAVDEPTLQTLGLA